jgi:uncharacterized protein YuzE
VAKTEVKMAVDPFRVISKALEKAKKRPSLRKVVSVDYDEEADVLYARFGHGRIINSEPLDADGMVLASLDSKEHIIGLTIIHASELSSNSH